MNDFVLHPFLSLAYINELVTTFCKSEVSKIASFCSLFLYIFCGPCRHLDSIYIMKCKEISHAVYSGNCSLNTLLCEERTSRPFSTGPCPPLPPASLSQYPAPATRTPTVFSQLSGKGAQAKNFLFELSKSI